MKTTKTLEQLDMELSFARQGFIEAVRDNLHDLQIEKWEKAYKLASDNYYSTKYKTNTNNDN